MFEVHFASSLNEHVHGFQAVYWRMCGLGEMAIPA